LPFSEPDQKKGRRDAGGITVSSGLEGGFELGEVGHRVKGFPWRCFEAD